MRVSSFLKLVEIQTKVASVFPFLLGTFYAMYRFGSFNTKNFFLMLVSLLGIDMATTAINNYMDFKKAIKKFGYGYEHHNAIGRDKLSEASVVAVIGVLLLIAVTFGFLLYMNTSEVVLLLGAVSFLIGLLYSFGPVPISRTPFGEIFSGGFMGLIIPFLATYIHVFDQGLLSFSLQAGMLSFGMNITEVLYLILLSLPAAAGIANIMLANNICDIEDDIENKRYTLPIYIGKENALAVFKALYYIGYAALAILLALRAVPPVTLLVFATFPLVRRHIQIFTKVQSKKDTFILAVKNFVVMNAALVLTLMVAVMIRRAA